MRSTENPVHYRIYVYDNAAPPLGQPTAVSLCPWRRRPLTTLTGNVSQVTCEICLKHIRELGLP